MKRKGVGPSRFRGLCNGDKSSLEVMHVLPPDSSANRPLLGSFPGFPTFLDGMKKVGKPENEARPFASGLFHILLLPILGGGGGLY